MQVRQAVLDLRAAPSDDAALDSQLLFGERVEVHAQADGWVWVQSGWDDYQGYCKLDALGEPVPPTHRVVVPRTFLYTAPDLKAPVISPVSLASEVTVKQFHDTSNGSYAELVDGTALYAPHLAPVDHVQADWISTAYGLLGTPYLWAGRSAMGADCSAFVQLALRMAGTFAFRDSDMQAATLGEELDPDTPLAELQAGDLVFWRGHVGLVSTSNNLVHCNARNMSAVEEPLDEAVERIANLYERPTGLRRVGI
ncbi:MAG: NlpC/P60 family protein [Pseudomonadota bacterium]